MTNTMKTYSTAHKLKKCVSVQKSIKDNSTNIGVGVYNDVPFFKNHLTTSILKCINSKSTKF